jgi:excisionase family DNA binding protein
MPTHSSEPFELLLTAKEAAALLRISPRTLWSLTNAGQIPCIRIRRAMRYVTADLLRWIEEQKQGGKEVQK